MPSDVTLETSHAGAVIHLRLSRAAKRNSLTREMLGELVVALAEAARDASVRMIVLGAEGQVFCAGMDLGQMQAAAARPDAPEIWRRDAELYKNVVAALWAATVPTLAVVQGPVIAGGVGLVAACDLVLASDAASFSLPEPRRGITAAIVTPLLVHRVGSAAGGHLLLSGATWDARTAHLRGLCDELVAAADLSKATEERIAGVLAGSPQALATTKANWRAWSTGDMPPKLNRAVAASAKARQSEDAREGLQAFLEKRNPRWCKPS